MGLRGLTGLAIGPLAARPPPPLRGTSPIGGGLFATYPLGICFWNEAMSK